MPYMYNVADITVLREVLMLFTDIYFGYCMGLMNLAKYSVCFSHCKRRH
jgi:hypothetical protein